MKAKSITGTSPEEIKTELTASMTDGFKPTLALVFLSISQDRNAICRTLEDEGIRIYGATTNGEFTEEVPVIDFAFMVSLCFLRQSFFF